MVTQKDEAAECIQMVRKLGEPIESLQVQPQPCQSTFAAPFSCCHKQVFATARLLCLPCQPTFAAPLSCFPKQVFATARLLCLPCQSIFAVPLPTLLKQRLVLMSLLCTALQRHDNQACCCAPCLSNYYLPSCFLEVDRHCIRSILSRLFWCLPSCQEDRTVLCAHAMVTCCSDISLACRKCSCTLQGADCTTSAPLTKQCLLSVVFLCLLCGVVHRPNAPCHVDNDKLFLVRCRKTSCCACTSAWRTSCMRQKPLLTSWLLASTLHQFKVGFTLIHLLDCAAV